MRSNWLLATLIAPATLALAACAEEPQDPEFISAPGAPLTLTNATRGLNIHAMQSLYNNTDVVARDLAAAESVVLWSQTFSEYEATQVGAGSEPRLENRVAAILDEPDLGPLVAGAGRRYLTVDLQRLDREWIVDWRGLDRDAPDVRQQSLTFQVRADQEQSDMQEALTESVLAALDEADGTISSVIIGTEMDRWYFDNPGDWPYYVQWVHATRDAIAAQYPDVRVGAGLNWSTFMTNIVPTFSVDGTIDYLTVLAAWEAVIDPLYFDAVNATPLLDFYAFSSIPDPLQFGGDPANIPWEHFAGIPTVFAEEPDRAQIPVAWFALGWPSNIDAPEPSGRFLTRFLEFNGGYDVELVAWWGFNHLLEGECNKMVSVDIGASTALCFAGMYPAIPVLSQQNQIVQAFFGER